MEIDPSPNGHLGWLSTIYILSTNGQTNEKNSYNLSFDWHMNGNNGFCNRVPLEHL